MTMHQNNPNHIQQCPVCSEPSQCKATDKTVSCWCMDFNVSSAARNDIKQQYGSANCLCANCLKKHTIK